MRRTAPCRRPFPYLAVTRSPGRMKGLPASRHSQARRGPLQGGRIPSGPLRVSRGLLAAASGVLLAVTGCTAST